MKVSSDHRKALEKEDKDYLFPKIDVAQQWQQQGCSDNPVDMKEAF